MKKYSHAWIAFMAIKRLEVIASTKTESVTKGLNEDVRKEAKALVGWFKDYRDFVIRGSWYPDEVFKDMSTSHIVKHAPSTSGYTSYGKLPTTHTIYRLMAKNSPLLETAYKLEGGNCADRCESLSHSIVDNFKMLHREDKGCPIATTGNHIAMRFFILSHYIADCHMPLHCDVRPFSEDKGLHALIEKEWEDQVSKSYKIDKDNNRFFYDPDGYPLHLKPTQFVLDVEEDLSKRKYIHSWGTDNENVWDFMSDVSHYSYLFARYLIPESFGTDRSFQDFLDDTEWGQRFDKYGVMIFSDAIDSLARIWLHIWIKYRSWLKP